MSVIFSMGVSLDGFIAGPGDTIDWTAPDAELHQFHNDGVREQGPQICGRKLYETWSTRPCDWTRCSCLGAAQHWAACGVAQTHRQRRREQGDGEDAEDRLQRRPVAQGAADSQ